MSNENWIQDELHYFHSVKKIIKSKSIEIGDLKEFKKYCFHIFLYSEKTRDLVLKYGLHSPDYYFRKSIFEIKDYYELDIIKEETMNYINDLNNIENSPSVHNSAVISESLDNKFKRKFENGFEYDPNFFIKGNQITEDFLELVKLYKNKNGIYKLYDKNLKLIYVGKSEENLGDRVLSSVKERVGAKYVKLSETVSKKDAALYEIYYIFKERPILNKAFNLDGELTVEFKLPELSFTNFVTAFLDDEDPDGSNLYFQIQKINQKEEFEKGLVEKQNRHLLNEIMEHEKYDEYIWSKEDFKLYGNQHSFRRRVYDLYIEDRTIVSPRGARTPAQILEESFTVRNLLKEHIYNYVRKIGIYDEKSINTAIEVILENFDYIQDGKKSFATGWNDALKVLCFLFNEDWSEVTRGFDELTVEKIKEEEEKIIEKKLKGEWID